ncbi:hypothetical protein HHK36_021961 [Tetracentron sinense]|uniref:Uncharacterized protein n=1 Tax=Tetracentron sinense TaxID=13715 RepID=A0A835D8G4_TETSI|nr:hypothetical protein HHK36_021961 [Tetracentron sinense]
MYSRRTGVVVWNLSFSRSLNDWEVSDFASLLSLLESVKLEESVSDRRVWAYNSSGCFSVKEYLQMEPTPHTSTKGVRRGGAEDEASRGASNYKGYMQGRSFLSF